VSQTYIIGIK